MEEESLDEKGETIRRKARPSNVFRWMGAIKSICERDNRDTRVIRFIAGFPFVALNSAINTLEDVTGFIHRAKSKCFFVDDLSPSLIPPCLFPLLTLNRYDRRVYFCRNTEFQKAWNLFRVDTRSLDLFTFHWTRCKVIRQRATVRTTVLRKHRKRQRRKQTLMSGATITKPDVFSVLTSMMII